jgi:hypothetical protein
MAPWVTLVAGIAGGALGVGGTCLGAWLTGRTQTANLKISLDAERERARLIDKRETYARCLAALTELQRTTARWHSYQSKPVTSESAHAEADRIIAGTSALTAVWELTLIARADVSAIANTAIEIIGKPDSSLESLGLVFSRLLEVMQADLNDIPIPRITDVGSGAPGPKS